MSKDALKYTAPYIAKVKKAAQEFEDLRDRKSHPEGKFDNAGRWYPAEYCPCCNNIRSPSRAYPYTLLTHCRSAAHLAYVYEIEASDIRSCSKMGIEVWAVKKALEAQKAEKAQKAIEKKTKEIVALAARDGLDALFV